MKQLVTDNLTGITKEVEFEEIIETARVPNEVADAKAVALAAMAKATTLASYKVATLNFLEVAGISG